MVKFAKLTPEEYRAVEKIVSRFLAMAPASYPATPLDVHMDISAAHASLPLQLVELSNADDFDLSHDVSGIAAHLNRDTGEIGGCFVPRFAVRQQVVEAMA